jgi:probable rRNA maturation factor
MIDVAVNGPAIPRLPRREITAFVQLVLAEAKRLRAYRHTVSEVSIAFVDDVQMAELNGRFRSKKKTTDVLTFPADESYANPGSQGRPLGDIIISTEQARRQASDEHHSLATEVRYLILHGILHALGYDHETDEGEMNALETKVRARVGLE